MVRTGSSPVLIGRTEELAALESLFEQAAEGQGAATVLVAGEAGVGKSRLVAELMARVRERGGRTLLGGAMEIEEANLPYVPILEALRPVVEEALEGQAEAADAIERARPEVARLFPELGPALTGSLAGDEMGMAQTRLFGQLLGVLSRLGRQRPVVLVIEDLQWADRSTRELVTFLGRTLHAARVLLVITVRTDALHSRHPVTPLLAELGRVERVTRITLERFSRHEHDEQVTAIIGHRPSAELLTQTYARSDGNPFFTEELIAPGGGTIALSSGLRDVLLARARNLSERTRRLLRVVAVGWSVTHPLLDAVAGLAPATLLESLREAVDRAILTTDPASGRYRFRHPLIAEAIYEDLLPGERIRIHAAFARRLEEQPSLADPSPARSAAELANHWLRAGEERRALPALVTAARAAHDAFAQAEAFGHLERALDILDVHPNGIDQIGMSRLELTRMAAGAAEGSGEFARAVQLWEQAIELHDDAADPVGAGLLRARAGEAYWLIGDREAFTALRRTAVEFIPADPPSAARSWVLSRLASALVMSPQFDEARQLAEEATEVARRVGAVAEEGRALGVLGVALLLGGDADGAVRHLTEALAISARLGQLDAEAIDRTNLSEALHEAGQLEEALALVVEGVERMHLAGLEHTYGEITNAVAIDRAFLRGKWRLAARLAEEALAPAPRGLPQVWLALVTAEFEAARGNAALADEALATADRLTTTPRVTGWSGPHEQRTHVALWAGRPAEALEHARFGIEVLEATGVPMRGRDWRWLCIHGLRAIGDLRLEPAIRRDPTRLAALADEAESLRERFERHRAAVTEGRIASPHLVADHLQLVAEHGRAIGRNDPDAWAAAADVWGALDHDFDTAVARWRQGEAALEARGAGSPEAAASLGEAHRLATEMGAAPLASAVEALARAGRISLTDTRPDGGATPSVLDSLTPREREVLALLAAGRSNAEIAEELFITAKTASVHITNLKAKLGVTTRVEAAALVHRLGLDEVETAEK